MWRVGVGCASVFLRKPDQGLIRKDKRPREQNFSRVNSLGRLTIRMQGDALHHEWIRDSSIPHALVPPKTACLPLPDGLQTGRACLMATITPIKVVPHTRIENSIIANMADIGVYCYAVFSAIKMHVNQATGDCFPSYATIARMTGIHRSTVIECVKKLTALKLLSPHWRYKENGSHASNQYNFQTPEKSGPSKSQGAGTSAPSKQADPSGQTDQGSRPELPPLVAQDDHPSRPEPPEQSSLLNKKNGTSALLASLPTEKQKTCQHPPAEIAYLTTENIHICHHCWGLLDENLTLVNTSVPPSPQIALPECEPLGEPEAMQPPVGNTFAKKATETPMSIPPNSPQMPPDGGKTAGVRHHVVFLGKWIVGALRAS